MKKYHFLLLLLILVGHFYLRHQFSGIGMERDEGIYTYIGQLILEGKKPYIDFYETRFAGIFYCYAALVAIFGYTIEGVALGILLINSLTILFLFDLTRRLFSAEAGLITAAGFVVLSISPDLSGYTRQSEHLVNFWSILGVWFVLLSHAETLKIKQHTVPSGLLLALSGASICWAMLVKPNAVYLIPAVGLVGILPAIFGNNRSKKRVFQGFLYYGVGVLSIFTLMCLVLWVQGSWSAFYEFAIVEAGKYAQKANKSEGSSTLRFIVDALTDWCAPLLFTAYFGLIALGFSKIGWVQKLTVWLLFVGGFCAVAAGWRFTGHYWLMWMPFFAIAMGAATAIMQTILTRYVKHFSAELSLILLVLPLIYHISTSSAYYFTPDFDRTLQFTYGINPFVETKKVGDWLAQKTLKGDKLALIGSEPQLYIYTRCKSPSRHAYFSYLMLDTTLTPRAKIWQQEFITDLEREMPRFVVFCNHPISLLQNENSDDRFFKWFSPFIHNNYRKIGCVELNTEAASHYILDDNQAANYLPKTESYINIYEKK